VLGPGRPQTCVDTTPPTPLAYANVPVRRVTPGTTFAFADAWDMTKQIMGTTVYQVSAANGGLTSTQAGGKLY